MTNQIRIIHTGKSTLGWDDITYRGVLLRETGKQSVKNCTPAELERVVTYMSCQGFTPMTRYGRRPSATIGRKGMLSKIEALLADAGRPWGDLDGGVERMLGVKKLVEWLNDDQVLKVMQKQ